MDFIDFFEKPLPKVDVNIQKIKIDMNNAEDTFGEIYIKNIGGDRLAGRILYNSRYISIDKDIIDENRVIIKYSAVSTGHNDINMINTNITIISNGGEVCIPVDIVYKNVYKLLCGGKFIHNIEQFYTYYKENIIEAIRIFYSYEFLIWLKNIKYKHIDMLEEILKDSNKKRAIDNFFILSGIKKRAYIKVLEKSFKYRYTKDENSTDILGEIPIMLIGQGYIEEEIISKDRFIKIVNSKITNKDFDKNNMLNIKFKIIKADIIKKYEKTNILFTKSLESATIEMIEKRPIEIVIPNKYLSNTGKSSIKIFNNTLKDIIIEISTKDTFIQFLSQKYIVSKYMEIPFSINTAGLLKIQMDFYKRANIEGEICIKANINGRVEKIIRKVYVGNSVI